MTKLTLVTFNFRDGGWGRPHGDYQDLPLLGDLVAQVPGVDVLFLQEGRAYDADGSRLLFEAERVLAPVAPLRGFLTPSQRGSLHELVFLRWPSIRPDRHYVPGPGVFHDKIGWLHAQADRLDRPLLLKSVQWPHWSGERRLDEALRMTDHAAPGVAAVVAGDFNCLWPGPDELEPDWQNRPPHKQLHKTLPPGRRPDSQLVSDRRALQALAEAGYVNVGSAAGDYTVTVNEDIDDGQGARIDHLLLSPWLAQFLVPSTYKVWTSELGNRASDHRMVSASLEITARGVCPRAARSGSHTKRQ